MRNGKSAGHDYVLFPEFLKKSFEKVITLLTRFFNRVLESGAVPDDWTLSVKEETRKIQIIIGVCPLPAVCVSFSFPLSLKKNEVGK